MNRRMKKRLYTLIGAILFDGILLSNLIYCLKKYIKYDNFIFLQRTYEGNIGMYRGLFFIGYFIFLTAFIAVSYAIIRYRGHIYDKYLK